MNRFALPAALSCTLLLLSATRSTAAPGFFGNNAYEFVAAPGISYDAAKAAAAAATFKGVNGHLVTIFSAAENDFVFRLLNGVDQSIWLGATDVPNEGQWRWVTGEQFWQGNAAGTVGPDVLFANWSPGQPDNFGNNGQHIAKMFGHIPSAPGPQPGQWDDGGGGTNGIFGIDGYVIEYEGVATPLSTPITFDGVITSPVTPEPIENLAVIYQPSGPGGNAFITDGYSFNGNTVPVTGNSNTRPDLALILDPTLCPVVLGTTCLSNGTHLLGADLPFGFSRQGGNHSLYSFEAAQVFPPGGCLTCGDPGEVLANATAMRLVGIRGGGIVADETFQLTSNFQKFTLTDADWKNVTRVVFEPQNGFAVIDNIRVGADEVDDDSDGVINLHEQLLGTDPLLPNTLQLSEGATGFFKTRLAVVNPGVDPAEFLLTQLTDAGQTFTRAYTLPAQQRLTIDVAELLGGAAVGVSSVLSTTRGGIVAERTMMWTAEDGSFYGGHTGKALTQARTTWYLAEGEAGAFDTYILLANANASSTDVTARFLLDDASTIERKYTVPPSTRLTIYANEVPGLAGRAFSTTITSVRPIAVERAMYLTNGGRLFNVGHEVPAIAAPSTTWFVAEGSTGWLFDEFLLLANPNSTAATATIRYLKPGGAVVTRTETLKPLSRTTLWLNQDPDLQDTDVSAQITATAPIIVERAMYWPRPMATWYEGHASAGVTATGNRWALAEGEVGGPLGFETYILFANPGAVDAVVTMTLLRVNQPPITVTVPVPANSRVTRAASELGLTDGEQFGALINSNQQIAVEHAMYWNGGGQFWGGGSNETGFRIR